MSKIKAVIPAAGLGTRFLPVTRVVPKEMLPIGARPALDLIVEEAKSAGAEEIVIVISEGKELIRKYFADDKSIHFVYQKDQRGLGHAVLQAAEFIGDDTEQVLILLGDAIVSGCNASFEMVQLSKANSGAAVIGLEEVPEEKISRYGIVRVVEGRITDMVEKPSVEEAPSNLAVAGRYLLDAKIFDELVKQEPGKAGEIQLTDSIRKMLEKVVHIGYVYPGKRLDIGNPKGYLEALKTMGENE